MRRTLSVALAALVAVLAASLALAGAARATTEGRIDAMKQSGEQLHIAFSATSLAPGATIDPASVAVTIGDEAVPATAKPFGQATEQASRTAVMALDTSGSMKKGGLAGAQAAADQFLKSVPADVRVGLVTFASDAKVLVEPTLDRGAVSAAVGDLTAHGKTALYDGVVAATKAAGTDGARSVILLSDGANTSGSATLRDAVAAVKDSGVRLDAVGLGQIGPTANRATARLTATGHGQVYGARAASDLTAAFAAKAASLNAAVVITAIVPPDQQNTQTVRVTAKAGGVEISDAAVTVLTPVGAAAAQGQPQDAGTPADAPAAVEGSSTAFLGQGWVAILALVLVFAGLASLVLIGISSSDTDEGRVSRRLAAYDVNDPDKRAKSAQERRSDVHKTAVELAGRITAKRDMDQMLGQKLEAAGLPLKPAEWLLIHVGSTFAGLLLLGMITGFKLPPMLMGIAVGFTLPYVYLSFKANRRRSQFADSVPDVLQLVAGSLAAGHSILQAFDTVVRETTGVMKEELGRAIVEARLGVPIEDSLETVAQRMGSEDFAWVVMAIRVNRQIGGDLAEVLRNVAGMIRERDRVRRQVSVLSAEGRLSAYVLCGLPIAFAAYMVMARPDYVSLLVTDPLGIAMTICGVVLMATGAFWMSRIIKVEI